MAKKSSISNNLSYWQVENIRLTAFPETPLQSQELRWWYSLVGEEPESSTYHPRTGELREIGPYESGTLSLSIQPNRIDWHLMQSPVPGQGLPTIGNFIEVSENFVKLISGWLNSKTPKLKRLAFGSVLQLPVDSRQDGYRQLSDYLSHVEIDVEGSSDFIYQINRTRDSNIDLKNLRINRLSKWSVAVFINTLLNIQPGLHRFEQILAPGMYACRLEIDINTIAEFPRTLPKGKVCLIFEELVSFGKEIVEKGDIS